ncbi:Calpain-like cysteine peptidase [Cichlidogyrus casuarinus]|uniref:Calpain-like cysteine peptidase n=1 Tax=Cichlidogyrus casuarinus TaxID=1844966 RepID=A0ABD2QK97_9PLAT
MEPIVVSDHTQALVSEQVLHVGMKVRVKFDICYDKFKTGYRANNTFKLIGGPSRQFEELRQVNLHRQTLFTDPAFPPEEASLYYSRKAPCSITWMRPTEIVAANTGTHVIGIGPRRMQYPSFIGEGGVQFGDLRQGELGQLSSVASLVLRPCSCFIYGQRPYAEKVSLI